MTEKTLNPSKEMTAAIEKGKLKLDPHDSELHKTVIATTVLYCRVPGKLLKKIYDELREFY